MEVHVEYIEWLKSELKKINEVPFKDIQLHKNGLPVDIPEDTIEFFEVSGLLNTDIVMYLD